jgi:hypothetical protein
MVSRKQKGDEEEGAEDKTPFKGIPPGTHFLQPGSTS